MAKTTATPSRADALASAPATAAPDTAAPGTPAPDTAAPGTPASPTPRATRVVRRAPSPMNFTDNLLADARHRYETTLEPLTTIALDLGISRTTLRSFAAKQGWVRFNAPPRDLSPAARLAQQTQAFVAAVAARPSPPDASGSEGAPHREPAVDRPDDKPADEPVTADWLRRELQAQVEIVRSLRENERAEPLTEETAIQLSRMLMQLTDTFIKLKRHTEGAAPTAAAYEDCPEDIDEFRLELARRINAFVAARTHAAHAVQSAEIVPEADGP